MLLGLLHLLPLASCHGLAAAHRLRGGAALTLPPLVGAYQSALAAAPITTNVLSAAGLSVLADGMAQAVERRGSWDVSRARAEPGLQWTPATPTVQRAPCR